jgi:putative addiction module killer protein
MIEMRKTQIFVQWLDSLRDIRARARIQTRIERLAMGNAGDVGVNDGQNNDNTL